jgi:drug/metabolite transporter (DMT)-like permease
LCSVAGPAWAVVLAGERLTLVQVLGGAVVIAGVKLHRKKSGGSLRRTGTEGCLETAQ